MGPSLSVQMRSKIYKPMKHFINVAMLLENSKLPWQQQLRYFYKVLEFPEVMERLASCLALSPKLSSDSFPVISWAKPLYFLELCCLLQLVSNSSSLLLQATNFLFLPYMFKQTEYHNAYSPETAWKKPTSSLSISSGPKSCPSYIKHIS